jgi:hypothetical protein
MFPYPKQCVEALGKSDHHLCFPLACMLENGNAKDFLFTQRWCTVKTSTCLFSSMMECHNTVQSSCFPQMFKWTHCLASKFTRPHITQTQCVDLGRTMCVFRDPGIIAPFAKILMKSSKGKDYLVFIIYIKFG